MWDGSDDGVGFWQQHLESPTALAAAQRHLLATLGEGSLKRPQQAPAPCPFQSHHHTAEPSRPTSLAGTRTLTASRRRRSAFAVASDRVSLAVFRAARVAALPGFHPSGTRSAARDARSTATADDWTARWGGHSHIEHLYNYYPCGLETKKLLRKPEDIVKRIYSTRNKRYL